MPDVLVAIQLPSLVLPNSTEMCDIIFNELINKERIYYKDLITESSIFKNLLGSHKNISYYAMNNPYTYSNHNKYNI